MIKNFEIKIKQKMVELRSYNVDVWMNLDSKEKILHDKLVIAIQTFSALMLIYLIISIIIYLRRNKMPYFVQRGSKLTLFLLIDSSIIALIATPIALISLTYYIFLKDIRITFIVQAMILLLMLNTQTGRFIYILVKIKKAQESSEWKTALNENYTSLVYIFVFPYIL